MLTPIRKAVQAKHVDDALFLRTVVALAGPEKRWVCRWNVDEQLPQYPSKVLLAKAGSLMKRGLLSGCVCGCRGDYVVLEKGEAIL